MDNFSGDSNSILVHKLHSLVRVFDLQHTRETKMALLMQLLLANENPAFYSAMIVSLKKSGTIGGYAREINNPSFDIENVDAPVENKPSPYLSDYQPTSEFVVPTESKIYDELQSPIGVVIARLDKGTSTIARIISGR